MPDLFNIAGSALLTYQRALETVGNNIANINTPGYSRQTVDISSRGGLVTGGGVSFEGVTRLGDPFFGERLLGSLSNLERADAISGMAGRVDQLLSDGSTGIAAPLRGFSAAMDQVIADPSSVAARQTLLSSAESLAAQFRQLSGNIESQMTELDGRIRGTVDEINGLTEQIASLNQSITRVLGQGGQQTPNDLLDKRDELVRQLSERIGVRTVEQDNGALNVFGSGGQPLVLDTRAETLSVARSPYGDGSPDIRISSQNGDVTITRQVSGGRLDGLLAARGEVLEPALAELGRLATAVASQVNAQQDAGADLLGGRGDAIFEISAPRAYAHENNAGTGAVTATVRDPAALTGRDYLLRFDGSVFTLHDANTGTAVSLSGSGTVVDPLQADGLSLVLSGSPAAGDSFLLRPTASTARDIRVTMTEPAGVAAAARISARAATDNAGAASPRISTLDNDDPALTNPAQISFLSATSYSLDGGPAVAWSPGDTIAANGWTLTLDGVPAAGDVFDIGPTPANSGDNSNARQMLAQFEGGFFDGGATSVQAASSQLVTRIGASAQRADAQRDALAAIVEHDRSNLESVSGVNLDEEVADMLRFEQAYQASAQVIATADSLFQALLGAIRR